LPVKSDFTFSAEQDKDKRKAQFQQPFFTKQ